MVRTGHRLLGFVVALGVGVGTLTGCGALGEDRSIVTADEIRAQEAELTSPSVEPQEQEAQPRKKPKPKRSKPTPVRSTATDADLDAYVAAGEKLLEESFGDAFEKIYSKIDIVPVYPNGVEFEYTFRVAVDPAAAEPGMNLQVPTLETQVRTVVVPEMEALGFADPTVTYTYRNPDGSIVWTRTFS